MKIATILGAIILAGAAPSLSAAPHTFGFSGAIVRMFEHDSASNNNTTVSASSMTGANIALGQIVAGFFAYDDEALPSPFDTNGSTDGYLVFSNAVTAFEFSIIGTGYSYAARTDFGNNIVLSDDSTNPVGYDSFSPYSYAPYDPDYFRSANLNLFDRSGTAVDGYTLPSSLNLSDFHFAQFHHAWLRQSDGDQLHVYADLTSLTAVLRLEANSVPEPVTVMLLLPAFAALVGPRFRRRLRFAQTS